MLLIETSTERAMVAIVEGAKLLFHRELPFGYQHSRHLLPTIDEALRSQNWTMQEIKAVGIGVGPGSYTGIRVGAMTAKALAYACELPLVGICTLHTLVPAHNAPFAALIDAKIGGVYVSLNGGPPHICSVEQLNLEGIAHIVTPHAAPLQAKLPSRLWSWEEHGPDPLRMAALVHKKMDKGTYSRDGQLELLYMRKTQAELERE